MNDFYLCREGRNVVIHYLRPDLGWLRPISPPTHHDAAACHGDVFKRLDAEGPTGPLTLLGLSAQGTSSNNPSMSALPLRNQDGIKSHDADPRAGGLS